MDKRILIIEDYPPTIDMIIGFLEHGYKNDFALDGPSGLEKAFADPPDLILLDIMLPGMDGLAVCRRLRADKRTAKVPIIIESAKISPDDIHQGLQAGADGYLTKPFTMEQMMELINKHIK